MAASNCGNPNSGEDISAASSADQIRANLAELNLTEEDFFDAVAWARANPSMHSPRD